MICSICNKNKPKKQFYVEHRKDGKIYVWRRCDPCVKKQRNAQWNAIPKRTRKAIGRRNRARLGKDYFKNLNLMTRYGLSLVQFKVMYKEQNGRCKICEIKFRGKAVKVDHNHSTGEIRGLLCHSCNTGLGHFRDSPKLLKKAIVYIS